MIVDRDLEDLVPGFLANRERDVGRIDTALATGDFDTIRMIGHSMKGAGGGYGFDAITDIGARIEQGGVARDLTAVKSANTELASYLQRLEVIYA
ncbi:MAG: Hpt domain-containing protein [Chromatiales bacterium]